MDSKHLDRISKASCTALRTSAATRGTEAPADPRPSDDDDDENSDQDEDEDDGKDDAAILPLRSDGNDPCERIVCGGGVQGQRRRDLDCGCRCRRSDAAVVIVVPDSTAP